MHKKWEKIKLGQITVEASIIVPVMIIIMASFIYIVFYAHDIISIRSGAYSMAIEENTKGLKNSLFVIRPEIIRTEKANQIKLKVHINTKGNTNFINRIINRKKDELLTAEKTMSPEILYAARALMDTKNKGEN